MAPTPPPSWDQPLGLSARCFPADLLPAPLWGRAAESDVEALGSIQMPPTPALLSSLIMKSSTAPAHGWTSAERLTTFVTGSSASCPRSAHSGTPPPRPMFQEGLVTLCCELVKWMTPLVTAHLLIPVIFKALHREGPGHSLQRPFAVLHPVETIEVTCLLLCAHSYLT